ncbi:MAG TPA: caspase family protein [Oculatellaceae cyanobacterium]
MLEPTPILPVPDPAALAQQALNLAELFYGQSKFAQAKEAYDRVLILRPDDYNIYNKRGVCKAALKDYRGALADYNTALSLRPDFYNAWVNRGNLKTYMKDYAGALFDYSQAIRLRPLDTVAYENRSELYSDLNRKDLALQDRATVIQLERLKPKKSMGLPGCPYRLALVLGNDDYYGTENDLQGGPTVDTQAMKRTLQQNGFEVVYGFNMTSLQMQQKVQEFIQKARQHPGAVTFIYYSGHGGSINGNNYMLPIEYDGSVDPEFHQNAVSVDSLLKELKTVPSLFNIMVLDSCRNPLTGFASRSWEAEPRPGLSNTWIEYASRPNEPALQDNRQGIYTKYLLHYMKDPNLSLKEVFMLASYALEQDPVAQSENQHARSQTDITKTEPFADSFYLARPCNTLYQHKPFLRSLTESWGTQGIPLRRNSGTLA